MSDIFENAPAEPVVKFDDLVGAGKKYADPDAVAKKIVHADKHITNLETEMAELRAELQARTTLEAMMNKLQAPATTERAADTTRQELGSENAPEKVDLATEVQKLLKMEKDKDKRETNVNQVRQALKDRFGENYNAKLNEIAEALEVTPKFLSDMGTSSPAGLLKLVDSVAKPEINKPGLPKGTNDLGRAVLNPQTKNKAYFDNIRKTDLEAYFSRKVQVEMHEQALRLGNQFYS